MNESEKRGHAEGSADERKVQLTQLELDRLIDRKFGDGYAKAEAKFKEELEAMKTRAAQLETENERLSAELEERGSPEDIQELQQLRARLQTLADAEKRSRIVSAAARAGAVDPEIVALALGDKVKEGESGELIPVGPDGLGLLGEDGRPLSLDAFVADFLNERPYLARPATRGGSGMGRSAAAGSVGSIEGLTPEEIKGMSARERRALVEKSKSFRW